MKQGKWTQDEVDFLREHFRVLTYQQISDHLQRSVSSITSIVYRLDLSETGRDLPPIQHPAGYWMVPLNKRHGKPSSFALVDETDLPLIKGYRWFEIPDDNTSYAATRKGKRGSTIQMHFLITGIKNIDHRNGNGLDNRRENLRISTRSQNRANSRKPRNFKKQPTSRYKGVCYHKSSRRWRTTIRQGGRSRTIGAFREEVEAAKAYDKAAKAAWGAFALLNFPEEDLS